MAISDLHMCGVTQAGRLWHTLRSIQGTAASWSPWEQVKGPDPFINIDCVRVAQPGSQGSDNPPLEFHILGVTQDGKLWHTVSAVAHQWRPFEDFGARIGGNWGAFQRVRAAQLLGKLRVCPIVLNEQGQRRILHTVRDTNGNWSGFEDANQPELASFPGSFVNVDCTGLWDSTEELHVCGVTDDGKLWHTRFSSAAHASGWQPFESVTSGNNPGPMNHISITGEPPTTGPQGEDPHCAPIQIQIGNDLSAMQGLQTQLASTTNSATINQLNVQIAGLQQAIAVLQQQAQQYNCPGSDTTPAFDNWMRE